MSRCASWPGGPRAVLPDSRLISGLVFCRRVQGEGGRDGLADRGTPSAGGRRAGRGGPAAQPDRGAFGGPGQGGGAGLAAGGRAGGGRPGHGRACRQRTRPKGRTAGRRGRRGLFHGSGRCRRGRRAPRRRCCPGCTRTCSKSRRMRGARCGRWNSRPRPAWTRRRRRPGACGPALARSLAAAAAASPRTEVCVTVTSPEGYAIGHGCARPERRSRSATQSGACGASPARLPARLNLTIPAEALTAVTPANQTSNMLSRSKKVAGHVLVTPGHAAVPVTV
jgi:hypothetical protein